MQNKPEAYCDPQLLNFNRLYKCKIKGLLLRTDEIARLIIIAKGYMLLYLKHKYSIKLQQLFFFFFF